MAGRECGVPDNLLTLFYRDALPTNGNLHAGTLLILIQPIASCSYQEADQTDGEVFGICGHKSLRGMGIPSHLRTPLTRNVT